MDGPMTKAQLLHSLITQVNSLAGELDHVIDGTTQVDNLSHEDTIQLNVAYGRLMIVKRYIRRGLKTK